MIKLSGKILFAMIVFATLFGCVRGKPIPAQYQSLIGTWEGNGFNLTITADGGASYHRISAKGETTFRGPLSSITDKEIGFGLLFIREKLPIEEPPHEVDGTYVMVVDNVKLVRKDVSIGTGAPAPEGTATENRKVQMTSGSNGGAQLVIMLVTWVIVMAVFLVPFALLNASIARRKGKNGVEYGWLSVIPGVGWFLSIYLLSLTDKDVLEKIDLILKNTEKTI